MDILLSYLSTIWAAILFALYPICLVILSALFTYTVTVESGAMNTIRDGLASVSDDKRVLSLLIVCGFGMFMEGMAGFGTAVAIPAAILAGIGFDPMKAILMCLVANTTPTAFGSVGIPVLTLAKITECEAGGLFVTTALLGMLITAATPFLVIVVSEGWRGLKDMWGYLIATDIAFLVPWILSAIYIGCELPNIIGGILVMVTIGVMASRGRTIGNASAQLKAWTPFGCVVVALGMAAFLPPAVKKFAPVGGIILIAAFCGGLIQGLRPLRMVKLLGTTVVKYRKAFITIVSVLVVARVLERAGVIAMLSEGLVAVTGRFYPFFSAAIGALGGFLTGSGTNSSVLFAKLQVGAAASIGASPSLLAAANMVGAGIGKMICPQSVAIGVASAGLVGAGAKDVVRRMAPFFAAVLLVACLTTGFAAVIWHATPGDCQNQSSISECK